MKKLRRKLKRLLISENFFYWLFIINFICLLLFAACELNSCAVYTVHDYRVRVHWIKKGEKAPFDGILLNKYTFKQLERKAEQCQK